ncbi:MAG: ABC transporter ATP-binding protein [Pseudomonadota bacterium]
MIAPLVSIKDLSVEFRTDTGIASALTGVSFDIPRGQVTAVVGESGSGKSVTANCIMRLLAASGRVSGGSIELFPADQSPFDVIALKPSDSRLHDLRGGLVSMVFQEPMTALSPVHTVGDQVSEAILSHRDVSREESQQRAMTMLQRVGLGEDIALLERYPFELSGGMRQRVVIAMALVCEPQLLICDEPTTALDVTIQAEILQLIRSLQQELDNAVLFITHDLGVVAQIAHNVVVMYQGRVLETGTVRQVLKTPLHPYTRGLIAAIPGQARLGQRLPTIEQVVGDFDLDEPHPLVPLSAGRSVALPTQDAQARLKAQMERGDV